MCACVYLESYVQEKDEYIVWGLSDLKHKKLVFLHISLSLNIYIYMCVCVCVCVCVCDLHFLLPSQLGMLSAPTDLLQMGGTPHSRGVLDMVLSSLMVEFQ